MTDIEFEDDRSSFYHAEGFQASTPTGALQLGPMEMQYQELFAEVLEDGIITADERARLHRAAANLGLNKERLVRLEEAMTAAYETHHRVRVVDHSVRPNPSLAPLRDAPPLPTGAVVASAPPPVSTPRTPELLALKEENARLKQKIAVLEQDLEKAQAAINVEVDLSSLDVEASATQSPEDAWKRVRHSPTDAEALRALVNAYDVAGDEDGKYLATHALSALGKAEPEEEAFVKAHRPTQLIAPCRSIDDSMWRSGLIHPEEEASTGAIFSIVAPAILVGRVTTLRRDNQLHQPAEDTLQDPATSTVMSVRALSWAAALLGLPVPRTYVEPNRRGAYVHNAGIPPVTILGADAVRGKTAPQLAFLVGQHMSGYRGEHFVRTLFSGTEDLEDLFLAALLVANPRLPVSGAKGARVQPIARAIEPLLEPAALDQLKSAYLHFAEEGGRTNLQRWSLATQKTAARVGLTLCQDLTVARDLLTPVEGQAGPIFLDLLSFSTGPKFLTLRQELGIAVARSGP